ncbi:MAG TPA: FKBP-type peptidyl-prolyl cis-trans isomerase, partial [Balneolaceae bacterium]|nr:FKBP-type peptidyl-prolyl cis-trans isomerase [Balneolaceae bacterium]
MISTKFKTLTFCSFVASALLFVGCNSNSGSSGNVDLKTSIDSVSYSMGYQNGKFLKQRGMTDIDPEVLRAGIEASLNEQKPKLSESEMQQVVRRYSMQARQKAQKQKMADSKKNQQKGEQFLAKNKDKEGVVTTDSGLQYKVLKEGSGVSPDSTDTVRVNYKGMLLDGTVFDSSEQHGQAAQFPLNRVIPGWTEGLQLMKEGAKYKFWIPGKLAYGQNPPPGSKIGPNQTLVFEVELLKVNPKTSPG